MEEQEGADQAPRHVRDLPWEEGERLSIEQQALHPAIHRITAWAADHPDVFAGVWLDNTDFLNGSGRVRIGVGIVAGETAEAAKSVETLHELVEDPRLLHVREVAHAERELRAVHDQIVARYLGRDLGAARVTGCGVDVEVNAMTVMLDRPDVQAEARLHAEFPSVRLRLEHGELRSLPLELDQPSPI